MPVDGPLVSIINFLGGINSLASYRDPITLRAPSVVRLSRRTLCSTCCRHSALCTLPCKINHGCCRPQRFDWVSRNTLAPKFVHNMFCILMFFFSYVTWGSWEYLSPPPPPAPSVGYGDPSTASEVKNQIPTYYGEPNGLSSPEKSPNFIRGQKEVAMRLVLVSLRATAHML